MLFHKLFFAPTLDTVFGYPVYDATKMEHTVSHHNGETGNQSPGKFPVVAGGIHAPCLARKAPILRSYLLIIKN
jgi:hypothetical protein